MPPSDRRQSTSFLSFKLFLGDSISQSSDLPLPYYSPTDNPGVETPVMCYHMGLYSQNLTRNP